MPTVNKFEVKRHRFKVSHNGQTWDLDDDEANELFEALRDKLGKPPALRYKGCEDRYSHGPHAWGADGLNYCTGRSFDAT